jgi:hypothetical protein
MRISHPATRGARGARRARRLGGGARATTRRIHPLYADPALPAPADFDCLVVLGGGMSVHDGDIHPWLEPERALIRDALAAGKTGDRPLPRGAAARPRPRRRGHPEPGARGRLLADPPRRRFSAPARALDRLPLARRHLRASGGRHPARRERRLPPPGFRHRRRPAGSGSSATSRPRPSGWTPAAPTTPTTSSPAAGCRTPPACARSATPIHRCTPPCSICWTHSSAAETARVSRVQ